MNDNDHHPAGEGDSRQQRPETKPRRIHLHDWRPILRRTKDEISRDDLPLVAAGVAFFILLGIIPGLATLISIAGLVLDPAVVQQQFDAMGDVIPSEARGILQDQLQRISGSSRLAGFGTIFGLLLALWSGSAAMKALIRALNIVHDQRERRSFLRFNLMALALTVGAVLVAMLALGAIVLLPIVLNWVGMNGTSWSLVALIRWPLLIALFAGSLTLLYRFGPNRERPRWRWLTWGSAVATALWIGASLLFSYYVAHFSSYNKTYGSLGAVVILLMWFYLSAFALLLGAEIDSEIEHHLRDDEPNASRSAASAA